MHHIDTPPSTPSTSGKLIKQTFYFDIFEYIQQKPQIAK